MKINSKFQIDCKDQSKEIPLSYMPKSLPMQIWNKIFSYCESKDIINASKVSKSFKWLAAHLFGRMSGKTFPKSQLHSLPYSAKTKESISAKHLVAIGKESSTLKEQALQAESKTANSKIDNALYLSNYFEIYDVLQKKIRKIRHDIHVGASYVFSKPALQVDGQTRIVLDLQKKLKPRSEIVYLDQAKNRLASIYFDGDKYFLDAKVSNLLIDCKALKLDRDLIFDQEDVALTFSGNITTTKQLFINSKHFTLQPNSKIDADNTIIKSSKCILHGDFYSKSALLLAREIENTGILKNKERLELQSNHFLNSGTLQIDGHYLTDCTHFKNMGDIRTSPLTVGEIKCSNFENNGSMKLEGTIRINAANLRLNGSFYCYESCLQASSTIVIGPNARLETGRFLHCKSAGYFHCEGQIGEIENSKVLVEAKQITQSKKSNIAISNLYMHASKIIVSGIINLKIASIRTELLANYGSIEIDEGIEVNAKEIANKGTLISNGDWISFCESFINTGKIAASIFFEIRCKGNYSNLGEFSSSGYCHISSKKIQLSGNTCLFEGKLDSEAIVIDQNALIKVGHFISLQAAGDLNCNGSILLDKEENCDKFNGIPPAIIIDAKHVRLGETSRINFFHDLIPSEIDIHTKTEISFNGVLESNTLYAYANKRIVSSKFAIVNCYNLHLHSEKNIELTGGIICANICNVEASHFSDGSDTQINCNMLSALGNEFKIHGTYAAEEIWLTCNGSINFDNCNIEAAQLLNTVSFKLVKNNAKLSGSTFIFKSDYIDSIEKTILKANNIQFESINLNLKSIDIKTAVYVLLKAARVKLGKNSIFVIDRLNVECCDLTFSGNLQQCSQAILLAKNNFAVSKYGKLYFNEFLHLSAENELSIQGHISHNDDFTNSMLSSLKDDSVGPFGHIHLKAKHCLMDGCLNGYSIVAESSEDYKVTERADMKANSRLIILSKFLGSKGNIRSNELVKLGAEKINLAEGSSTSSGIQVLLECSRLQVMQATMNAGKLIEIKKADEILIQNHSSLVSSGRIALSSKLIKMENGLVKASDIYLLDSNDVSLANGKFQADNLLVIKTLRMYANNSIEAGNFTLKCEYKALIGERARIEVQNIFHFSLEELVNRGSLISHFKLIGEVKKCITNFYNASLVVLADKLAPSSEDPDKQENPLMQITAESVWNTGTMRANCNASYSLNRFFVNGFTGFSTLEETAAGCVCASVEAKSLNFVAGALISVGGTLKAEELRSSSLISVVMGLVQAWSNNINALICINAGIQVPHFGKIGSYLKSITTVNFETFKSCINEENIKIAIGLFLTSLKLLAPALGTGLSIGWNALLLTMQFPSILGQLKQLRKKNDIELRDIIPFIVTCKGLALQASSLYSQAINCKKQFLGSKKETDQELKELTVLEIASKVTESILLTFAPSSTEASLINVGLPSLKLTANSQSSTLFNFTSPGHTEAAYITAKSFYTARLLGNTISDSLTLEGQKLDLGGINSANSTNIIVDSLNVVENQKFTHAYISAEELKQQADLLLSNESRVQAGKHTLQEGTKFKLNNKGNQPSSKIDYKSKQTEVHGDFSLEEASADSNDFILKGDGKAAFDHAQKINIDNLTVEAKAYIRFLASDDVHLGVAKIAGQGLIQGSNVTANQMTLPGSLDCLEKSTLIGGNLDIENNGNISVKGNSHAHFKTLEIEGGKASLGEKDANSGAGTTAKAFETSTESASGQQSDSSTLTTEELTAGAGSEITTNSQSVLKAGIANVKEGSSIQSNDQSELVFENLNLTDAGSKVKTAGDSKLYSNVANIQSGAMLHISDQSVAQVKKVSVSGDGTKTILDKNGILTAEEVTVKDQAKLQMKDQASGFVEKLNLENNGQAETSGTAEMVAGEVTLTEGSSYALSEQSSLRSNHVNITKNSELKGQGQSQIQAQKIIVEDSLIDLSDKTYFQGDGLYIKGHGKLAVHSETELYLHDLWGDQTAQIHLDEAKNICIDNFNYDGTLVMNQSLVNIINAAALGENSQTLAKNSGIVSQHDLNFMGKIKVEGYAAFTAKDMLNTSANSSFNGDGSLALESEGGSLAGSITTRDLFLENNNLSNHNDLLNGTGSYTKIKPSGMLSYKTNKSFTINQAINRSIHLALSCHSLDINADCTAKGLAFTTTHGDLNANANLRGAELLALRSEKNLTTNGHSFDSGGLLAFKAKEKCNLNKSEVTGKESFIQGDGQINSIASKVKGTLYLQVEGGDLNAICSETVYKGKHDTMKTYQPAEFIGGTGEGNNGIGMTIKTNSITNDASRFYSEGTMNLAVGAGGFKSTARTHEYISHKHKHHGFFGSKKKVETDVQVQKAEFISGNEINILSEGGSVFAAGTDFLTRKGLHVESKNKDIDFQDMVVTTRSSKHKSSFFGLKSSSHKAKDEHSISTTIKNTENGKNTFRTVEAGKVNLLGVKLQTSGLTGFDSADPISIKARVLNHERSDKRTDFGVSLFGFPVIGKNGKKEPIVRPDPTTTNISRLAHSKGIGETAANSLNTAMELTDSINTIGNALDRGEALKALSERYTGINFEPKVDLSFSKTKTKQKYQTKEGDIETDDLVLITRSKAYVEGVDITVRQNMKVSAPVFEQKGPKLGYEMESTSESYTLSFTPKSTIPDVGVAVGKGSAKGKYYAQQQLYVGGNLDMDVDIWNMEDATANVGSLSGRASIINAETHTNDFKSNSTFVRAGTDGNVGFQVQNVSEKSIANPCGIHVRSDLRSENFQTDKINLKGARITADGQLTIKPELISVWDVKMSNKSKTFGGGTNIKNVFNDQVQFSNPCGYNNTLNPKPQTPIKAIPANLSTNKEKQTLHSVVHGEKGTIIDSEKSGPGKLVTDTTDGRGKKHEKSHSYQMAIPLPTRPNWERVTSAAERLSGVLKKESPTEPLHNKMKEIFQIEGEETIKKEIRTGYLAADIVYNDDLGKAGAENNGLRIPENGIYEDSSNDTRIVIYVNDAEKKMIVAVRGTASLGYAATVDKDIALGLTLTSIENNDCKNFLDKQIADYKSQGFDVVTAGHSGGATQASIISSNYKIPGLVFDNPGLPQGKYDLSKVISFQSRRDLVNGFPKLKGEYDYGNVWQLPELPSDVGYNAAVSAAIRFPLARIPAAAHHLLHFHGLAKIGDRLEYTLNNDASGSGCAIANYDPKSKNNPQSANERLNESIDKFKESQLAMHRAKKDKEEIQPTSEYVDQAVKYGFQAKKMNDSNWSLFEAVNHQLKIKNVYQNMDAKLLATTAVQHIQKNRNAYELIGKDARDAGTFYKELLDKQAKPDENAIRALSRELGLTIVILKNNQEAPTVFKARKSYATIYLQESADKHYSSLLPGFVKKPEKNIASVINNAPYDN